MVNSHNLISHKFQNTAHRLTNDGASKVADMHFFGDVGGRVVDYYAFFLGGWVVKVMHHGVYLGFDQ